MGAYLSSPKKDKDSEEGENNRLRFGATTMQGWRMNQEDAHNCIPNFDEKCSFFAVYDGHGGPEVSKYAAKYFPELLKSSELWINSKIEKALEDSFLKFDENLLDEKVIAELKALGDIVDVEVDDDEEDKARLMEEATLPLEQVLSRYGIQLRMKRDEFCEDILMSSDDNDSEKSLTSRKTKIVAEINEQNGHSESETANTKEDIRRQSDEKTGQRSSLKRDFNGNSLCNPSTAISSQITTTTSQSANASGDSNICSSPSDRAHNGPTQTADSPMPPEGKKMRLQSNEDQISTTDDNKDSSNSYSTDQFSRNKSDGTSEMGSQRHRVENTSENEKGQAVACQMLQNGVVDDSKNIESNAAESKPDKVLKSSVRFETKTLEISETVGIVHEASDTLTCQIDSDKSSARGKKSKAVHEKEITCESEQVENGSTDLVNQGIGNKDEDEENEEDEEEDDEEYEDTSDDEEENDGGREADDEDDEEEDEDEDDDEDDAPDDFERDFARAALENMEQYPGPVEELPGNSSGTTACVLLIKDETVYVANAGDSRCVLCRDGKAFDLSVDHKPEDDIERKRIEAAGGAITEDGRVNGGLNLSRALGDHFYKSNKDIPLKDQMISPFPDVQVEKLTAEDSFLVLACDGIWNSMSSQAVVDFVDARLKAGLSPVKICEEICDSCLAETTVGDGTGCDNMTIIVVDLKKRALVSPQPTDGDSTVTPDVASAPIKNIRPPNASTDLDPKAADRPSSPAPVDPVPVV